MRGRELRNECLQKAADCVLRSRNQQYGEAEDNFADIAAVWQVYLERFVRNRPLYAHDVAAMMILLKVMRGDQSDTWIDIAGYAACGYGCSPEAIHKWHEESDNA